MIRLENLRAGLQLVHNCQPVELLYFERRKRTAELWRAQEEIAMSFIRPIVCSLSLSSAAFGKVGTAALSGTITDPQAP